MTDTTTLAPCPFCGGDANIRAVARDWWKLLIDHANECMLSGHFEDAIVPQEDADKAELAHRWNRRATLAKWGAPAPASGETETCKCCGEGSARIVVRRECDTCTSVYDGVAEHRIQKSLAEPPAQEVLLNPDMPTQELRLHMGELTTDEVLVARAAIRWANTYGITAAQKETP